MGELKLNNRRPTLKDIYFTEQILLKLKLPMVTKSKTPVASGRGELKLLHWGLRERSDVYMELICYNC